MTYIRLGIVRKTVGKIGFGWYLRHFTTILTAASLGIWQDPEDLKCGSTCPVCVAEIQSSYLQSTCQAPESTKFDLIRSASLKGEYHMA
jgi:hypothetical protein